MKYTTPLRILVLGSIVSAALLVGAAPARAVMLDWAGNVTLVEEDTGTGLFAGAGVGAAFNGGFVYGSSCGAGCSTFNEPNEANYAFLGPGFGAFVAQGLTTRAADLVFINIQDDHALDADEAALVSLLTGTTVAAGTLVDVWTAGSETEDAVFDEEEDLLLQGGTAEVVFLSFDTSLFDDTSYRPLPPALGDVDLAGFIIEQAIAGELVYQVFGVLGTTSVVPEPGAALLLAPALAVLLAQRRRAH
jgi:hypothetical protein